MNHPFIKRPGTLPAHCRGVLFLLLVLLAGCGESYRQATAERRQLVEAVYASGNVAPRDAYQVFGAGSGIVEEVYVQAGDPVEKGQPLVRLRMEQPRVQRKEAAQRVARLRRRLQPDSPQLAELRYAVQQARERFEQDSTDYARYQRLLQQDATAKRKAETAHTRMETSRAAVEMARRRLASVRDELEGQYEAALRNLELLQSREEDYVVRSRYRGRVYDRMVEPGNAVSPQQPLLLLGRAAQYMLELIVDESDINRVKEGQEVIVRLDNYPDDSTFRAEITRIFPRLNPATNAFDVEASFVQAPAKLFAGVSAEANILIRQKEDALTIPRSFLLEGDSVWVEVDGKKQKQHIGIGLRSLERVEVTRGLQAGQAIYLPE